MFSAGSCVYYDITTHRKQEPRDLESRSNSVMGAITKTVFLINNMLL